MIEYIERRSNSADCKVTHKEFETDRQEFSPHGDNNQPIQRNIAEEASVVATVRPDPVEAANDDAAKETTSINNVTVNGADGGSFSLQQGSPIRYDLFSNESISLNGKLDWEVDLINQLSGSTLPPNPDNDLRSTELTVTNLDKRYDKNIIRFDKSGHALIDGEIMRRGEIYVLKDGGAAFLSGSTISVKTAEGDNIKQTADHMNGCINVEVESSG